MGSDFTSEAAMSASATLQAGQRDGKADGGARQKPSSVEKRQRAAKRRAAEGDDDLPPLDTTRWVIRRKAQLVAAIESGRFTLEEICRRYSLSVEEFQSWKKSLERHGIHGLRSTRLQIYRDNISTKRSE